MKVAFATQDLKRVDAHFGWARNIAIYDLEPEGYSFVEALQFEGDLKEDGKADKLVVYWYVAKGALRTRSALRCTSRAGSMRTRP